MTKVKELLNIRINEHIEDILSVPWSHLSRENVSYWLIVCRFPTESHSNRFGICLNDSGYPFQKKSCHPFKWLGLSVRKKMSSVWTACAICSNGLGYPFEKKFSSIRTAWAIPIWKKLLSVRTAMATHSKKKLSTVWATEDICSKINVNRVSIPKQFCC